MSRNQPPQASLQTALITGEQPKSKFKRYGLPALATCVGILNILETTYSLAGLVNGNFWSNYNDNYTAGCNDALTHSANNPPRSGDVAETGRVDAVFSSNNIPFQGGILVPLMSLACYAGSKMLMTKNSSIPVSIASFTLIFGLALGIPASLALWSPDDGVPDGSYMGYEDGYTICSNATTPPYSSQYTFPSTETYLNTAGRVLLSLAAYLTLSALGAASGDRKFSMLFNSADSAVEAKANSGCCITEMEEDAADSKVAAVAQFT